MDGYDHEMHLLTMDTEEYAAAVVQTLQKISVNLNKARLEGNKNTKLGVVILHIDRTNKQTTKNKLNNKWKGPSSRQRTVTQLVA